MSINVSMSLVGEYEPGSCSPSMQSSSWARRSSLLLLWTRALLQETFICRWGRGGTRRTLITRNMRVPNGCADTRPTFSPFRTLPGCNCNRFHEVLHYEYVPKTRDTALRHCCHNEGVSTASWPKKAFLRRWWILHGSITPLRQDGRVIIYIEKISICEIFFLFQDLLRRSARQKADISRILFSLRQINFKLNC